MENNNPIIILIDDDQLNNMVCKMTFNYVNKDFFVQTFSEPELGLSYIQDFLSKENNTKIILLLDINMPTLSGWDVLDEIDKFSEIIQNNLTIYMLSTSVDPCDKERANNNHLVTGYIEKPISQSNIVSILG